VTPAAPSACDSVLFTVGGAFADGCNRIVATGVSDPQPIPELMGPLPAYRTRISIRVERRGGDLCTLDAPTYQRELRHAPLPFGQHVVTAVETVFDSTGAPIDTSSATTSFVVAGNDSCGPQSCAFLNFSPPAEGPDPGTNLSCDGFAMPGGQGCFDVDLGNTIAAGGVQLTIQIIDQAGEVVPGRAFTPRSVATTERSANMQAQWDADGSTVKVVLFSPSDNAISPGRGSILRVCYDVGGDVPGGVYRLVFGRTLVADGRGQEIPPCPLLRMATGRFCVGAEPGCDVDGDGVATVRDIIRIVRCALAGDACPDSIAGRSDCNGDGSIDVRDVICCVHKLLRQPYTPDDPAAPGGTPTRIGWEGAATWTSPLSGRAALKVEPSAAFGAVEFEVVAPYGLRITSLAAEAIQGARLEWAQGNGRVRALLIREGTAAATSGHVVVGFERTVNGDVGGDLTLLAVRSSSWDAAAAPFTLTAPFAPVAPSGPFPAPTIFAPRPNPFSGTTEIPFAMPAAGHVSVRVYDVSGRLVRTLVDGERPAGVGRASWNGRDTAGRSSATGIYFVKFRAAGVERTLRLMKLR